MKKEKPTQKIVKKIKGAEGETSKRIARVYSMDTHAKRDGWVVYIYF